MKTIWVVFTSNNARILVNPSPAQKELVARDGFYALENPDLSDVKRVPPHFWVPEAGRVRCMTPEEMAKRLADLGERGVDNAVGTPEPPPPASVDERGRIAKAWASMGQWLRNWKKGE